MSKIYDASLVGKKESVVDEILLLNPHQTPLLNLLGFSNPVTQTTHQWFEDEMFAYESTVDGAVAVDATSITVADAEPFRAGHVVKVGEELLLVTAINDNTLTVTRGYASTQATAIDSGAKIEVLFVEGQEGADARNGRYKKRVKRSNLTQIFDDTILVSGTAQAVENHGINDIYEYEKQKKQLELALQLEKALINGIEYEDGQVRQMRGIRSFINTNVVNASGSSLNADHINNLAQDIYEKGGFAEGGDFKILVPAKQKRAISAFDSNNMRLERQDNGRGSVADYFVSDFGQFEIAVTNNLDAGELALVDANRVKVRPLIGRDFFHKYLGEKGDYVEGTLVGEYTLEFKQEKAHGRIKNLG